MGDDIKTRPMQYMQCQQGDLHEGEQLNFVCLEPNCKDIGLVCPVCRQQKHQKHKVIPLKVFLADISTHLNSKQNANSIDTLLNQVDQVHQKMLVGLRDSIQKMALQVKSLEEQIHASHKNTRQRIMDQNQTQLNFPLVFQQILNSQYKNVDQLRHDVRRIIENVSQQQGKIEIEFKPQKVFEQYQKSSTDYTAQLNQLSATFKTQLQKVSKQLEKISVPVVQHLWYQFSNTMKSDSIIVTDQRVVTQTVSQNYDNRFALIEPVLIESSKVSLKILTLANFIGVGICLKNVLTAKKYKFDYNSLGHGCYMISSNGYCWSHSKSEENIKMKAFKFHQGEIVTVDYNQEQKTVTFFNKTSQAPEFKLMIDIPENEEVHFCVNLCSQNDKVEIVQEESQELKL